MGLVNDNNCDEFGHGTFVNLQARSVALVKEFATCLKIR